jgi:pimeloyl-ACP methyl ester carboxylesterase
VVLFHYPDTTPEGERRATAQTLEVAARAASGQPFVMVGASFGGRIVIEAAAQHPDGLRAIVSVSGEAEDNAWRNILGDARGVTVPALYVGARHDQFTEGTRQQRALHRAMRGSPNLRVELAGPGHGTDLLDPTTAVGRAGLRQVVAFVGRVLPSGSR